MQGEKGLHADLPLKVVAIGGGTGLAALLRALKPEAGRARDPWKLTGIVTVSDDGGSSGRLRDELGVIPPGDLRNCLAALTREESVVSELLNYRFQGEGSLAGHSLGNLMLLAMADLTGDWVRAIRQLSGVLVTVGRLYPSTVVPVVLRAEDMTGRRYTGETSVNAAHPPLARLWVEPFGAEPLPEAILAILQADVILLAPGSLYTSTIASLLIPELRASISRAALPVVYVANLMTEPGESTGMSLEDHVAAIQAFSGFPLEAVITNTTPVPAKRLRRYLHEGGTPLTATGDRVCGVRVHPYGILDPDAEMARHHPVLLNHAIREVIASL